MEPWQSLASPAGHRSLCLLLQELEGPQPLAQVAFPGTLCLRFLLCNATTIYLLWQTPLVCLVYHAQDSPPQFPPLLSSSPLPSEVSTNLSASPPPSTRSTSQAFLTLAPIGKEIVRSSVSSQFLREETGDGTAPGLYPLCRTGEQAVDSLSSADLTILAFSIAVLSPLTSFVSERYPLQTRRQIQSGGLFW